MPGSVIVPAHDEERVLPRTLGKLLSGLPLDVQVLVVPNGCRDRTAEVARSFGPRVEVVEVEEASKTAALNAGDSAARGYPRVYLDADVDLSGGDLAKVLATLEAGAVAAEPVACLETRGASACVRAYYAVWRALHGREPGDVGCGLYALSEVGRARFGAFPSVISDDGFVRAHFAPGEIRHVTEAESVVLTPRSLGGLLKIKTRSRLGALQLEQRFPDLWARKRELGRSLGQKMLGLPVHLWPLLPLYALVQVLVRRRAGRLALDLEGYRWERDESSR
jgi:glycosyltransferase involved in cell wall biosynthesis